LYTDSKLLNRLWKGDKVELPGAECIVVVTDTGKQNDLMFERPVDIKRWLRDSGGAFGATNVYNGINYAVPLQPRPFRARETTGGSIMRLSQRIVLIYR
jgi:hypothetical protein